MWKDIKGYEGQYQISNEGEVYSTPLDGKPHKLLKQNLDKRNHTNYKRVALCKNGKVNYFFIHRLVAIHFIPNIDNKPDINHIDNNGENNNQTNLEWVTKIENMKHSSIQGRQDRTRLMGGIALGEIKRKAKLERLNALVGQTFGMRTLIKITDTGKHPKGKFLCLNCFKYFQGNLAYKELESNNILACRSCSIILSKKTKI